MSSDDQINHEKSYVAGGHIEDRGQPSLPVAQRRLANGSPLGLLSFATGIFLISSFGVHARGVQTPNVMISVLVFFGGVCQYIVSIMEFIAGNTFGATVFASYAAFNVSYSMIYLPGSGIITAYTDPKTGALSPDFQQAIALYLWAWFILTVIYTIAAVRTTWILFLDLFTLDICLALLAVGNMMDHQATITAGYAFGYLVAALSYWAGCAGLFGDGLTPFNVPIFPLHKTD
ncbi:GPR1/FUN34/yaaH family-domain-containing protein [Dactylonectria estremocensis]|uniref:GPR1/FUN34/yaaH family-domain-containing protein n=1 Tax=Dactylonectria estremocensis TaxID=1079267 RepID=A0A9P9IAQ3_9HYPO|nr:GPR1/FUN34/yaaH family-domain-containing protein [Dactylonectria estremocensis]